MEQYIKKDALVEEIDNLLDKGKYHEEYDCAHRDGNNCALYALKGKLDTIEVKEVDLEKHLKEDIEDVLFDLDGVAVKGATHYLTVEDVKDIAKHFFELGLNASNPITEVNLESRVRQVIDLYLEAGEHYNSVIKDERKEYGGSDLVIKLLDGIIDAKELGIQYVLDKLKAQKEEKI